MEHYSFVGHLVDADMGTFFPLGGSDLRLGGGGGGPKKFACGGQKKESRRFLRKFFYYVEKIAIPPQPVSAGGMEVLRGGGIYPHTPHAHVCVDGTLLESP